MTNEKYQGWTNWDTWNAYLWLSNDEQLYRMCRRYAGLPGFETKAWDLLVDATGNPDEITKSEVNWTEVEEAFKDTE